jgi:hypothetical protein
MKSRYLLALILCAGILIAPRSLRSQDQQKIPLKEAIEATEKKANVKFFYRNEWIKEVLVKRDLPLQELLTTLLKENGIGYLFFFDAHYIILFKGNPPVSRVQLQAQKDSLSRASSVDDGEKKDVYKVYGYIKDAITGERIVGATVLAEDQMKGTVTNVEGYYSLSLTAGVHRLKITSVSKLATMQGINLTENQRLDVEMYEQTTQLDDVVIMSQGADRNISSTEMSQLKIDIKTLRTIPQFMGEVDVIKSILLLPGVKTVGEGASGFNVRGGQVDQNLILLDEAPLFNSSHLFGFFSTFNPDFVKDVTLMKGGMPANYGGRISSVLDVKLRDGNPTKFGVSGGLGIISSRLLVEGPLGSEKTSFIIGGRYAYPDWIIKKVPDLNVQQSSSNFYDLNFRIRHQFNDKNNVYLSVYKSADEFKFAADTTYGWSTTNATLRWNTTLSASLYANVTALYSNYQNKISGLLATKEFDANFGIETKGAKVDLTYAPGVQNRLDFGASFLSYKFNNGKLIPGSGSSINPVTLQDEYSLETGFYVSDEYKINASLSVHGGLRYSQYSVYGPADVNVYDPTVPMRPSTVTDVKHFSDGDLIQQYSGWEPRFSMKVSLDPTSSVKISYNRNLQYLQLISNTTAVSPLDLWKSSNYHVKPQIGNQVALGYFKNLQQNRYEISLEGYYKEVENLVEYKDGANLFMNPYLESALLNAKGQAFGVEFMMRKKEGKLTGWFSYTFSRSFKLVNGGTPEETLNQGKRYPSNFDKPHDLTIVANYAFTRRLSLSANFTYSTGRPITYPQSVYMLDGYAVSQFSERNQVRIPDYHRLDISFTIEESLKRTKKWKGSWTFSIYNVYGRPNPYSVFFKPQYNGFQTQSFRLAVIGTIFPSVTYNFKF